MKRIKRISAILIMLSLLLTFMPVGVFAAHDSTGRPLDLTGKVYLSVFNGSGFPGEPAEHSSSKYTQLTSDLTVGSTSSVYAGSADTVLKPTVLDDVVEGTRSSNWLWTNYVWGVYNAEGNNQYLLETSVLNNPAAQQQIIRKVKGLADNADVSGYEIVWYVIKYQTSDSAWHIDGVIKEKDRYTVNYYGNGSTSGTAPDGRIDLLAGQSYTVLGNTGSLQKKIGNNTYVFQGWNTMPDGTGVHYEQNDVITIKDNVTLYAEWYLPNNYTATVATYLDDAPTNLAAIHGEDVSLAISSDGKTFTELTKTQTGVYSVVVTQNGTYNVYHAHDGEYHQVENYQLTIYNKNARVEVYHYSVSYDTAGGVWQGSDDPGFQSYFHGTTVYATTAIPYRSDANFLGWVDQNGNEIAPNGLIALSLDEKTVLTARWETSINVKVNITINHKNGTDFDSNAVTRHNMFYQLLRLSGTVNEPVGDRVQLTPDSHEGFDYSYDSTNRVTRYTMQAGVYAYMDLPEGVYTAHTAKSHYSHTITVTDELDAQGNKTGNIIIDIEYLFEPNDFDMDFQIKMDPSVPKELYPQAVNIKIYAWKRVNGVLGWYPIAEHSGDAAPINIPMNPETGVASGFYSVWQTWADLDEAYYYRVAVTAYVLPDGTIVPATGSDYTTYTIEGGLYVGTVDVIGGSVPDFPEGSNTDLPGAYYDPTADNEQSGMPTITITAHPYTVTFNAMGGTINGQAVQVFENQYRHMDHAHFLPVREGGYVFDGWYLDEACTIPAHDEYHGDLLTENVTHYAKWKEPVKIQGTIIVDGSYGDDAVNATDRVQETVVILEKLEHGSYNQVGSFYLTFNNYMQDMYSGSYSFTGIPDDGSEYRITVVELNYLSTYDNNGDSRYTGSEYTALFTNGTATVNVHLDFEPETYEQQIVVDASSFAEAYKPQNVELEIVYRDLGDILPYTTIVQHLDGGIVVTLTPNGTTYAGYGSETIWIYHTDGALYEYQINITTVDGKSYNSYSSPYTIVYDPPAYFDNEKGGQSAALRATLVPKSYTVSFDLGLGIGEYVTGMDGYINGDGTYSTTHTWGFDKTIDAKPVRPGYYFKGWKCVTTGVDFFNNVISADAAKDIILEAQWERVTGYSYSVYFLDYDTGAVLYPTVVTDNMKVGDVVYAASEILGIVGYDFHSANVNSITITEDNDKNVIVLYYVVETGAGGSVSNPIDDHLHMSKTAVLNDDGTYTIRLEVYATNNPISTYMRQDTPLDIVLVLDQSGSMYNDGYLDDLQLAADEFISMVASHGRGFGIDHRIAIVGFASNSTDGSSNNGGPIVGSTSSWINTGIFDSNGTFHNYGSAGFKYTALGSTVPETDGVYYVLIAGEAGTSTAVYNRLMYHDKYYHLLNKEDAVATYQDGTQIYGFHNDAYVPLTLVGSEWTYNGQMYSGNDYYTYHEDVWTHRDDMDQRMIHAYGTGSNYRVDSTHGHTDSNVYSRTATTTVGDKSIYVDALVPVTTGKNGTGPISPGLLSSIDSIGGSGGTRTQYGIEMANEIFAANPIDENNKRVRVMVVFTDGQPGQSGYLASEANAAVEKAYVTKNTYGAKVYTIGLYDSNGTNATDNTSIFMNALSSNYPNATSVDSIYTATGSYQQLPAGTVLDQNGTYYVKYNNNYYQLKYGTVRVNWQNKTGWYFTRNSSNTMISETASPTLDSSSKLGTYVVYKMGQTGYHPTEHSGYYQTNGNVEELYVLFDNIVVDITTKTSTEIVLHADGIVRDVLGSGLVLTEGTVITATSIPGLYVSENNIVWNESGAMTFASLALKDGTSTQQVTVDIPQKDGTVVQKNIYQIAVYNTNPENTYTPNGPHTVDVSGYDFSTAFISSDHVNGYKLVVEITRVEATDDVIWSHTMSTNNAKSGVWAPADENGYRELLASFDQPSTIFAHRQYVLDYSQAYTLDGWYYTIGANSGVVSIDSDLTDGMNWFDPSNPNSSVKTKYGVVRIVDGKVIYTPTTTCWDGYDTFYVFGRSGHAAIVSQNANQNGNLWTKVDIIPANNVYFEDSFVSGYDSTIDADRFGFVFGSGWSVDYAGALPETNEGSNSTPHGWTEDLSDDLMYSDGTAHVTSQRGASVTFTFTGTGVDIYSRTDSKTGMVVATLKKLTVDGSGNETYVTTKTLIVDNLAMSGTYYQIPTLSFGPLEYGTYQVLLVATSAPATQTGEVRYHFYLDGIRVYNPLINPDTTVNDAYGRDEMNAVFTPIRDILLTNQDFNPDMSDSTDGKAGAVFVDWIKDGQGAEGDGTGTGAFTYQVGTYADLGPKNEVYLAPGQTIVLKVDPANTYYVGMKCLAGISVKVGVSGTDGTDPVLYTIGHSSDLYYKVQPVNGYIVITNASADGSGNLLSLTKLRATNASGQPVNGGVLYVSAQEALEMTAAFMEALYAAPEVPPQPPVESEQDLQHREQMEVLYVDIRKWLETEA